MKIKNLFQRYLAAIACWALMAGFAVAQQPFDLQPEPEPEKQAAQEEPIIVRPNQNRAAGRQFQSPDDESEIPDQPVLLNAKFVGWEGAEPATKAARISKTLRANWIMVDSNGRFEGRVFAGEGADISNMTVYLMNMGRLVKETVVNEQGVFQFSNVREGAYALVGWGAKGFFAFGLNILDHNDAATAEMPRTINVIAFQNASSINTDWIRFFSPRVNYRVYGRYLAGEGQDDPPALFGLAGLRQFLPKAIPATSISGHQVQLTAQGSLLGRVHQLTSETGRPVDVRSTRVMLLKGDDVVGATDADNYGVFEFPAVANGQYGLMAVGVDGMGLIGIDVGDPAPMNDKGEFSDDKALTPFDFCLISSETVGWMNHYATELAYRRNLLAPRRPSPDEMNRQCPNCEGSGCNTCQGTGLCTSRCQSFEDWAANCANQHERTKLGSGYILSEASKDLRRAVKTSDNLFENAFYGSSNGGSNSMNGQDFGGSQPGTDYFGQPSNGEGFGSPSPGTYSPNPGPYNQ